MAYPEYSLEATLAEFFAQTSATRPECDLRAEELVHGHATPVKVQGNCSYSVYCGPSLEYVVQFRPRSLQLDTETASLARRLYGTLVPTVSFAGQVGDQGQDEKEPLYVYVMSRIMGVTHLDFRLARDDPENCPENFARRRRLMIDMARFFALAWKNPQPVDEAYRTAMKKRFERELSMLLEALPSRLQSHVRKCLEFLDAIFSLPFVLLNEHFSVCNIMVDEAFHLVGVVDGADSEISPFGLNLSCLQCLAGKLHLRNGWERYDDYDTLQDVFWTTFTDEVGDLTDECIEAIRQARITGFLLSHGFTSRLANKPEPVPIGDDERGRYNMLSLDGFLVNPATRFEGIE